MKKYYLLIKEVKKFTNSPLVKAFQKQKKAIQDQGIKQVEALKALKPEENPEGLKPTEGLYSKEIRTNEVQFEKNEVKKFGDKIKRKYLKVKSFLKVS